MAVVCFRGVSFGFVSPPVIDNVDLSIERGERIGLLGRNGAGKSTLMRLISGDLVQDSGVIERQAGTHVARLEQDVPVGRTGTVFDEVAAGLGEVGSAISAFNRLHHSTEPLTDAERTELEQKSATLNPETTWQFEHRVDQVLDRMQLNPTLKFDSLSSGMKRCGYRSSGSPIKA